MRNYDEMTTSVLKKVHENDIAREKRRKTALRTAIPVCGVLAVAGAITLTQIKYSVPTSGDDTAGRITAEGDSALTGGWSIDGGAALTGDWSIDGAEYGAGASNPGNKIIGESIDEDGNTSYVYTEPAVVSPNEGGDSAVTSEAQTNPDRKFDRERLVEAPEELNVTCCLPFANNIEKLTRDEAIKYYGIDIFALEKNIRDCTAKDSEFALQKCDDRLVYDGNFVEFGFEGSDEYITALFRKESKWIPADVYESEDIFGTGDTEVTLFKNDGETIAVFEVNGTQITLLYHGEDVVKRLYNAIKVYAYASGLDENENAAICY